MCGIAGIVNRHKINLAALHEMLRIQSHRGPDGSGQWISPDEKVAIGHRRLSIIDLSEKAGQPMTDVSGKYIITFNGEIYNYIEIRTELKRMGAFFQSESDTEVILEAYKQWGEACLERFNGMFAFAIYDMHNEKLFCARDRYGEKPFLFATGKDFFIFASEYKALLQLKEISCSYDPLRLIRFCHTDRFGLDGERQTVFRDIQQLLPSEKLSLNIRSLEYQIERYWDVYPNSDYAQMTDNEAQERFRELFVDSVRIRMRSDVPVGSCLSGGLDSSSIVGIARKLIGKEAAYHTFTGRFPGTPEDEWEYAEIVVKHNQTVSHIVEPTPQRLSEQIADFIWHNELPLGGTSQFAQWCVFHLAKQHGITVLLDGQGGDELLGGYEGLFYFYLQSLREMRKNNLLSRESQDIKKRYPLALSPKWRTVRDSLPFGLRCFMANLMGKGTSLLFGIRGEWVPKVLQENQDKRLSRFNALVSALYNETFGRFLTTLLRYGDRNSMAHSREVRLPFCDHRLPELVFSLPPEYIMGEIQTKRLLRKGLRNFLPEKIQSRWNKQGFRPPQSLWFAHNPMIDRVREIIYSPEFKNSELWQPEWWYQVLKRVEQGDLGVSSSLWHPYIVESWKRYFINQFKKTSTHSIWK
jgi:asparagine synthase (glutamine-hydrolysing)